MIFHQNKQPGAHRNLADLYAPGLLAEEATPLARCIDLTRKWAGRIKLAARHLGQERMGHRA